MAEDRVVLRHPDLEGRTITVPRSSAHVRMRNGWVLAEETTGSEPAPTVKATAPIQHIDINTNASPED